MAYEINQYCTACGDCLPICPNFAISEGRPIYRINPFFCTECVGYAEEPQCATACHVGAISLAPPSKPGWIGGPPKHGTLSIKPI